MSPRIKICEYCGEQFHWRVGKDSAKRFGSRRYCGKKCSGHAPRDKTAISNRMKLRNADQWGEKNPNWKGGITYTTRLHRKSGGHKRWRRLVLERDNHSCVWCGSTDNLHVDHIKPFIKYPELRLDINNGRTLCADCHIKTPTYGRNIYAY